MKNFDKKRHIFYLDLLSNQFHHQGFDYWIETNTTEEKLEILKDSENFDDSLKAFIKWNWFNARSRSQTKWFSIMKQAVSNMMTYEDKNEMFRNQACKLIPQTTRQIVDVKRIAKLEKLLDDMYLHFTNANQDIVSYAEDNQDSLLLTGPFQDYLKDIHYRLSTYGQNLLTNKGKGTSVPNVVEKVIRGIEKDFDYYFNNV